MNQSYCLGDYRYCLGDLDSMGWTTVKELFVGPYIVMTVNNSNNSNMSKMQVFNLYSWPGKKQNRLRDKKDKSNWIKEKEKRYSREMYGDSNKNGIRIAILLIRE